MCLMPESVRTTDLPKAVLVWKSMKTTALGEPCRLASIADKLIDYVHCQFAYPYIAQELFEMFFQTLNYPVGFHGFVNRHHAWAWRYMSHEYHMVFPCVLTNLVAFGDQPLNQPAYVGRELRVFETEAKAREFLDKYLAEN